MSTAQRATDSASPSYGLYLMADHHAVPMWEVEDGFVYLYKHMQAQLLERDKKIRKLLLEVTRLNSFCWRMELMPEEKTSTTEYNDKVTKTAWRKDQELKPHLKAMRIIGKTPRGVGCIIKKLVCANVPGLTRGHGGKPPIVIAGVKCAASAQRNCGQPSRCVRLLIHVGLMWLQVRQLARGFLTR